MLQYGLPVVSELLVPPNGDNHKVSIFYGKTRFYKKFSKTFFDLQYKDIAFFYINVHPFSPQKIRKSQERGPGTSIPLQIECVI